MHSSFASPSAKSVRKYFPEIFTLSNSVSIKYTAMYIQTRLSKTELPPLPSPSVFYETEYNRFNYRKIITDLCLKALRFERKLFSDSSSTTATPEIYRKIASTNAVCLSRIVVQHKNIQNNNRAFQGKGEPTQRLNPSSTYRSSGPGKAPWNGRYTASRQYIE